MSYLNTKKKIKIVKIGFSALLLSFSFLSWGQSKLDLLFIQDPDIKGQKTFVQENELSTYTIFYQNFFVTDNKVDEAKLKRQIESKIPSETATGFAVLDWEGEAIKVFQNQDDQEKLDFYINEFLKAIRLAKKLRPNVKWGYYHILYISYWGKISDFRKQNKKLEPIIREQDFIAPSLYVYNTGLRYKISGHKYLRKKLLQALEMGDKYNLPVYPFVWHRTPKKTGHEFIPVEVFEHVVNLISSTEYSGKTAKGIFWWHSESYSYRNRKRFDVAKREYFNVKDLDTYQYDMFKEYYGSIEKYIHKN
ncbi:Hyaluronidase [Sinomicrobium oceani]|uniref:Hyaluronidase n=1 Tax=Sinomicrobium oceani TaxID=1150368 RepID=A0A1K1R104_9FLAO|nr:hypothetical protein [Sinomicrobium oceani]SFW65262.1 Hyaluronidase [Sinomicrobium oceani]